MCVPCHPVYPRLDKQPFTSGIAGINQVINVTACNQFFYDIKLCFCPFLYFQTVISGEWNIFRIPFFIFVIDVLRIFKLHEVSYCPCDDIAVIFHISTLVLSDTQYTGYVTSCGRFFCNY